jgi:hypothetical protein
MASWSAGPKCGNCNHAAESGRRWDEMEGRYQCAVLAPYKSGALDSRMVCFLRHRGRSPVVVNPTSDLSGPTNATACRNYTCGERAGGSGCVHSTSCHLVTHGFQNVRMPLSPARSPRTLYTCHPSPPPPPPRRRRASDAAPRAQGGRVDMGKNGHAHVRSVGAARSLGFRV